MPNQKRTAIRNCYKKNKIPRNKTHKQRKGSLQGKVQTTAQRNQRTQTDGETFHVHG